MNNPQVNDKIWLYLRRRYHEGAHTAILKGGRRSGKTWHLLQWAGLRCVYFPRRVVSVAAMTNDQGRLGSFADMGEIIEAYPALFANTDPNTSPLEIRYPNGSKMVFKSYRRSETAKGIKCNDLFINEANCFSYQQYVDLRVNVTGMTFLDYNPNFKFWVDDIFKPEDICTTTWQDNKDHLTPAQLEYFADLKARAESPNATSVDLYNYSVYYLGEYAEIDGAIFTRANIRTAAELPRRENGDLALRNFAIFADPSALRGADYFATCLTATDDDGNVWLIDSDSRNTGGREDVARWMQDTCKAWDVKKCFIETNGLVGIDFYEFAENSGLPVEGWYSRGNKYQRIVDNYQNLTTRLVVLDTERNRAFLEQVYTFAEKCEHDDNVDALNSSYNMQRWTA
jgi:predicted phage terminase large subunit-like protein